VADQKFWSFLKDQRFEIRRDTTSESRVRTFNLVETTLVPPDGVSADRIRRHPLKVAWRVLLPDGSRKLFAVPGAVRLGGRLSHSLRQAIERHGCTSWIYQHS